MIRKVLLSAIVFAAFFSLIFLWSGGSGQFNFFFDPSSLVMIPIGPIVYMLVLKGPKGTAAAFRAVSGKDSSRKDLEGAIVYFKSLGTATWVFGIIGSMQAIIIILTYLPDPTRLGPNIALAILTILYAGIFHCVLILPFLTLARDRIALEK